MSGSTLKRVVPYLITLALAVFLYLQAGHFDVVSRPGMPGPDLWPKMACVLLGATSLIGVLGALFGAAEEPQQEEVDEALASPPEIHPYLVWVSIATTGLFVGMLPYLGFFAATTLYASALLVIGGMRRWAWVPAIGLALAGVFTLIFMRLVYVALPLGVGVFKQLSLLVFKLLGIH